MNSTKNLVLSSALLLAAACGEGDPEGSPDANRDDTDAAPMVDAAPQPDGSSACEPLADDYTPRDNGSADDTWAACISDDNAYHPFDPSISSIARVAAFEEIADLLFTGAAPSPQDFIDAQLIYLEDNGLDSRVSRREDEHYPPAPEACNQMTSMEQEMYPDRCVGPVQIQPIILQAFTDGANGDEPRLNAARIEAALLWFFYVSSYKEGTTCTQTVNDCDSCWAYYGGGEDRSGGLGLARYVRERSVATHDRVYDGILAVRCWRDLDNPGGEAQDLDMRDQALAQLDRALLHGVSLIVRDRMSQLDDAAGLDRDVLWTFLQILGPVLDREATARDATAAATMRTEIEKSDPATVNVDAYVTALDSVFPCP